MSISGESPWVTEITEGTGQKQLKKKNFHPNSAVEANDRISL